MPIEELETLPPFINLYPPDNNGRQIDAFLVKDASVVSNSLVYPTILLSHASSPRIVRPINETIMSLRDVSAIDDYELQPIRSRQDSPVFFFGYNVENYYHFLYDTLPYLISYFKLKEKEPDLKLLMGYPNAHKKEHYKFVREFLELAGVQPADIIQMEHNCAYARLYLSTSYTHAGKSNLPPRAEVYKLYEKMAQRSRQYQKDPAPRKIYISRRTWMHNDFSNIGTNYTTRRSLVNETDLVDYLAGEGYTEVFTENLSTVEKINMFNRATHIVGALGGGIANALFATPDTKVTAIESPGFLEVNKRFLYALGRVDLDIFRETSHSESGDFLKYMRVKSGDIIGEIADISGDSITISYTDDFVAGWNNDGEYKHTIVKGDDCVKLDSGLNSAWQVDMESFRRGGY